MHLPVIVGMGGMNAAGRSSYDHALRRMIFSSLDTSAQQTTLAEFFLLMNLGNLVRTDAGDAYVASAGEQLNAADVAQRFGAHILNHTLIRPIESRYFFPDAVPCHTQIHLRNADSHAFTAYTDSKEVPSHLSGAWRATTSAGQHNNIYAEKGLDVFLPNTRSLDVAVAGMSPTGFDPAKLYAVRDHPRGLQMGLFAASDAMNASGLDWERIRHQIAPDRIAVFAASALGQLDEHAMGGMLSAAAHGKRVTAKQLPFSYPQMIADFVNAYVLGSVGHAGSSVGACASFLYNLQTAVDLIKQNKLDVALVGATEAPIIPALMEGFDTMGALAKGKMTLEQFGYLHAGVDTGLRRTSRPFADNNGFVMGESAQFFVLTSAQVALDLGADILGSVPYVFSSADGYKKSIASPGIGNYITMAKALAAGKSVVGEKIMQQKSYVHAHGTSTPQNRTTESDILNRVAAAFGITAWQVAAVKCYLGHSQAAASADQLASVCSSWQQGLIPGISTLDKVADDVSHSHLQISNEHKENRHEVALINAKGFGGNNASATVLSPSATKRLIESHYGVRLDNAQKQAADAVRTASANYYEQIQKGVLPIRYRFGYAVKTGRDVRITDSSIEIDGMPAIPLDGFDDFACKDED